MISIRCLRGIGLIAVLAAALMIGGSVRACDEAAAATPAPAAAVTNVKVVAPAVPEATTDVVEPVVESEADCEGLALPGEDLTSSVETETQVAAAACKQCPKPRAWCKCTYNGMRRYSCDPCCYTNDIGGVIVCLD